MFAFFRNKSVSHTLHFNVVRHVEQSDNFYNYDRRLDSSTKVRVCVHIELSKNK